MIPEMKPVDSSNIASVGYAGPTRELHIRFKSGGHYAYANVPPDLHQKLLDAPSKTKFLRAMVIGKHQHTKVDLDAR